MTISRLPWLSGLDSKSGPKYKAIAETIADAVANGGLAPGDRLPPQRELAWALNCTVGTVTRAYALIEKQGLAAGEVGRGTFISLDPADARGGRDFATFWHSPSLGGGAQPLRTMDGISDWRTAGGPAESDNGPIRLNHDYPPLGLESLEASRTMAQLASDPVLIEMLSYQPHAGIDRHRAAGAAWMARRGVSAVGDRVVVTTGAHNGVLATLSAITHAGDAIAVEALAYPGIKAIAGILGLRLIPVALDAEGITPEALDHVCRQHRVAALYTVPTLQNPTNATMSAARREAVAQVAAAHRLPVVEDDILGMLVEDGPPALCSFLPSELGFYVCSISKTLAPGLRTGYVLAPDRHTPQVAAAVRTSSWMASPFTAEIVARWIETDAADRILESHRREIAGRRELILQAFDGMEVACPQGALHAWLTLPSPWRAGQFVAEAQDLGIIVPPSDAFVVGDRETPHAVRLSFCPPRRRERLQKALSSLSGLLSGTSRVEAVQVL